MNIEDFLYTPKIELVSIADEIVTFHSSREFRASDRVRFDVDAKSVKVRVLETRDQTEGQYLYTAEILEGHEHLLSHFGETEPQYTPKRRVQRIPHRMRIISQKFPSFQALSLDFSPLGLKVQVEGPIEQGSVIPLVIDFDWPGQEPIEAWAKVAWCQDNSGKQLAGLEFIDVPALTQEFIQAFYHEMASGEIGNVAKAMAHHKEAMAAVEEASAKQTPAKTRLTLSGHIDAYTMEGDRLKLSVINEEERIIWNFSELHFLRDNRGITGLDVVEAWEVFQSAELQAGNAHRPVPLLHPATPLRHIQLINRSRLIVLELVAASSEIL